VPAADIARALFVAFIYGVSFVAIRAAVEDWPPLLVTGYRFFFAAIPLIFFVTRPAVSIVALAGYGFMQGTVMFGLAFVAIAMGMPAGLTSLVVQMQVFFTIVFAALLLHEYPDRRQQAGIVIGFAGIAVLALSQSGVPLLPFSMVIGAAIAWGIANIIAKIAKPTRNESLGFVIWSSLFGALPLFALSSWLEGTYPGIPPHMPEWTTVAAIFFLAIITQIWAFSPWVGLLNRHSAPKVMPYALLIPVFGFASTAMAYGERYTPVIIVGSAIVFAGLAVSIIRPKRVQNSPHRS